MRYIFFLRFQGFNTLSQGQYSQTRQMQTMAMKTRQSLIQLLQKLVHGSPHFIRCLRRCKTASATVVLDKAYLADQIRGCNLVETIRIRQNGYAYRIPFVEFLRRFGHKRHNLFCQHFDFKYVLN